MWEINIYNYHINRSKRTSQFTAWTPKNCPHPNTSSNIANSLLFCWPSTDYFSIISYTCWAAIFCCVGFAGWPSYWNLCPRSAACGRSVGSPSGTICGLWFPGRTVLGAGCCTWGSARSGLWWYEHPSAGPHRTDLIATRPHLWSCCPTTSGWSLPSTINNFNANNILISNRIFHSLFYHPSRRGRGL